MRGISKSIINSNKIFFIDTDDQLKIVIIQ